MAMAKIFSIASGLAFVFAFMSRFDTLVVFSSIITFCFGNVLLPLRSGSLLLLKIEILQTCVSFLQSS